MNATMVAKCAVLPVFAVLSSLTTNLRSNRDNQAINEILFVPLSS